MTEKQKFMLVRIIPFVAVVTTGLIWFDVKVEHHRLWTSLLFWTLWNVFYFTVLRPLIDRFILEPAIRRSLAAKLREKL